MKIVRQTPTRLIVVQRSEGAVRPFLAAGALLFVGLCGLTLEILIEEAVAGNVGSVVICAALLLMSLFPVYLCLRLLFAVHTYDFDGDADRFVIRERKLLRRTEAVGKVSRITSVNLKIDYSGVSTDTGPSSELTVRHVGGHGATETVTCGWGVVEDDKRLHQTLKAFLKL